MAADIQEIPIDVAGRGGFSVRVDLSGTRWILKLLWRQRQDRWYLSVYREDGTPLALAVKVVCGRSLLRKTAAEDAPPGYLIALSDGPDVTPAKYADLGQRVRLWYYLEDA